MILIFLFLTKTAAATDFKEHYAKWWQRATDFHEQTITRGEYKIKFYTERKIDNQYSLIENIEVSKNDKLVFEIDESAAVVLLDKNKRNIILTVPLNSDGDENVPLVTHVITEKDIKTVCHKDEIKRAISGKNTKKKSKNKTSKLDDIYNSGSKSGNEEASVEQSEYNTELAHFRKYLKEVGCF